MITTQNLIGIGTALSPIVHNEILEYGADTGRKGEAKHQRTMPFILQTRTGSHIIEVPVVSGNAMRGLMRRLLIDFSLDTLDIKLGEIFNKPEEARKVLQFIRGGGLTAKDSVLKPVTAGTYAEIRSALPFLSLLGGVFQGHHFEGSCKIGILIPLTQETYPLYENIVGKNISDISNLPKLDDIRILNKAVRYTRKAESERTQTTDKEQMIYGTDTIPAGTTFFTLNTCITEELGTKLAFKAMFALLEQYGYVGGMSGRGHGKMTFEYSYTEDNQNVILDIPTALKDYSNYLLENKEEIIKALQSIPILLQVGKEKTESESEE